MTTLDKFGEYLKSARIRKGLSLRAVESETDISNAYLSQLEQGKIKQPSPKVLFTLSQLYSVSYKELMRLVGYPVPDEDNTEGTEFAARMGPVTEDEQDELIDYLKFLRSRRKRED